MPRMGDDGYAEAGNRSIGPRSWLDVSVADGAVEGVGLNDGSPCAESSANALPDVAQMATATPSDARATSLDVQLVMFILEPNARDQSV